MPGGNGMGPMGMGPMTGRGAGYCAGYAVPGFMNPVGGGFMGRGFGLGRGRGRGRGFGAAFYATGMPGWQGAGMGYPAFGAAPVAPVAPMAVSEDQQAAALRQQAEYFENALAEVKQRIEELSAQPKQQ